MTDTPPVEPLDHPDAADLLRLSQAIGWAHSSDDWHTILEVGRVFGHRADGGFASSGALFDFGATFASIGMILVAPAYRGQGLARAIIRHCLAAAGSRAVTLIATPQGEPLYRSLGFVEVERVSRVFTARRPGVQSLPTITTRALADVVRFDQETFGADRSALLHAFFARASASAIVSDAHGVIRGFGMAVRQGGRLVIGPVAAREPDGAIALFRSLAVDDADEIRIDVPTRQTLVLEALTARGGRRVDDAPVMLYGAAAMPGRRDEIYALASRGLG